MKIMYLQREMVENMNKIGYLQQMVSDLTQRINV